MNISRFFIDRPIFATVVSIVITVAGLLSLQVLPISEYPEVVPPTVQVRAVFPGASPETIAQTVATPLEEQINGVEDMLYMSSQATTDGVMQLTVTFAIGTDVDLAQVQVQNRVNQALPRLPEEVRRQGVAAVKSSPDLTLVVHLTSPNRRYDVLYLRNYALIQIRDVLARLPDMGNVRIFGAGDYAMRIWLDPAKVAARNLTAAEVVQAVQQQNVQVSAGILGGPPLVQQVPFQLTDQHPGPSGRRGGVRRGGDPHRPRGPDHQASGRRPDRAGGAGLRAAVRPGQCRRGSHRRFPASRGQCAPAVPSGSAPRWRSCPRIFPRACSYQIVYDPTVFVSESIREVVKTLFEAVLLVVIVVVLFLQTWRASVIPLVAVPVSIVGTFAVLLGFGFSINTLTLFGLVLAIGIVVDDAIVVVENVERNIELGLEPKEAAYRAMEEVTGPIIAIALVLCAVFVPVALVPGFTGQFYRQFALTIAFSTVISAINSLTLSPGPRGDPAPAPRGAARPADPAAGPRVGLDLPALQPVLQGRVGALRSAEWKRLATRPGWPLAVYAGLLALTVLVFRTGARRVHPAAGQAVPGGDRPAARCLVARPHRLGAPEDGGYRPEASGGGARGPVHRAFGERVRQRAQPGHRVLPAQAVRGAPRPEALRARRWPRR